MALQQTSKAISYFAYLGIAAVVINFTIGMLGIVLPYFPYTYGHDFLATKSQDLLQNNFYLVSFYIHITTSFVGLATGLLQFCLPLIQKARAWHKWLGRCYAYSILLLACPSGLVLALTANGGTISKTAFTLQCILWFSTTLLGVQAALQKKWLKHVQYFIISYATTLAAFSLRTESHLLHTFVGGDRETIYQIVTWSSWVGNAIIALLLIELGLAKYLVKKAFVKS
ncbi:MAG: hypothetical protein RL660_1943 [Bacteroidota bacterium]|jgi:hypothetical protein